MCEVENEKKKKKIKKSSLLIWNKEGYLKLKLLEKKFICHFIIGITEFSCQNSGFRKRKRLICKWSMPLKSEI